MTTKLLGIDKLISINPSKTIEFVGRAYADKQQIAQFIALLNSDKKVLYVQSDTVSCKRFKELILNSSQLPNDLKILKDIYLIDVEDFGKVNLKLFGMIIVDCMDFMKLKSRLSSVDSIKIIINNTRRDMFDDSVKLQFNLSAERQKFKQALLSGGEIEDGEVLSFENSKGDVFEVKECLVQRKYKTEIHNCSVYIGRLDILSF